MSIYSIRNFLVATICILCLFPFKTGFRSIPSGSVRECVGASTLEVNMGFCFLLAEVNHKQIKLRMLKEVEGFKLVDALKGKTVNDEYLYFSTINLSKTILFISPFLFLFILTLRVKDDEIVVEPVIIKPINNETLLQIKSLEASEMQMAIDMDFEGMVQVRQHIDRITKQTYMSLLDTIK